jgi:hypothetical protein
MGGNKYSSMVLLEVLLIGASQVFRVEHIRGVNIVRIFFMINWNEEAGFQRGQ